MTTPTAKTVAKPNAAIGCLGVIGFAVLLAAAIGIWSALSTPTHSTVTTLHLGDFGHVQNATHTTLVIGFDENLFKQFVSATDARDRVMVEQILLTGQFAEVPSGTPVQVLNWNEPPLPRRLVKVLSGTQAGKAGWVLNEMLVP